MIKSMTGFGKSSCEFTDKKIHIECKSLNSKQLDLSMKIPSIYKEKEFEMRSLLASKLERGKIECFIYYELSQEVQKININRDLIKKYAAEFSAIAEEINQPVTDLLPLIVRMPDVFNSQASTLSDEEWNALQQCLQASIEQLEETRIQEGKVLKQDFVQRIGLIESLLQEIIPFEERRIKAIRERIQKNLEMLVDKSKIDENRFEQELFYYLEKLDITEEKVRLKKHCEYFLEIIEQPSTGKKLSFIVQEIGREINTIGSKANDVDIQRRVVMMKDELEKIKEQMANIL